MGYSFLLLVLLLGVLVGNAIAQLLLASVVSVIVGIFSGFAMCFLMKHADFEGTYVHGMESDNSKKKLRRKSATRPERDSFKIRATQRATRAARAVSENASFTASFTKTTVTSSANTFVQVLRRTTGKPEDKKPTKIQEKNKQKIEEQNRKKLGVGR